VTLSMSSIASNTSAAVRFLVAAFLILFVRHARADSYVSLELQVPRKEEPAHLCVVTARATKLVAQQSKALAYSSLPLKALVLDIHGRIAAIPPEVKENAGFEAILKTLTEAQPAAAAQPAGRLREEKAPVGTDEAPLPACAEPLPECDARLDQTPAVREWFDKDLLDKQKLELHLSCGWNMAHPNTRGPVVFVALNLIQGSDVPVTEIRLDGSVAAIRIAGNVGDKASAAVRVIGGHYAPSLTSFTTGGRAVLPLQPLCSNSILQLPAAEGVASNIKQISLERRAADSKFQLVRECRPEVAENSFMMRLPFQEQRVEQRVKSSMGNDAELEVSWFESAPPARMNMQFKQVSFSWAPDCLYDLPRLGCPRVWLEGKECNGGRPALGECKFACTTDGAFTLPASVEFIAEVSQQRWTDRLGRPAERLFGLTETPLRQLRVDFGAWNGLPDIERASIDGVRIELPDRSLVFIDLRGKIFNLDQKPSEVIELEDQELSDVKLSCRQPIPYRVQGLPRYSPHGAAPIKNGRIELHSPECQGSACMSIESAVRVGLLSRGAEGSIEPSNFGTGIYVNGDVAGRYVPWGGWWFVDAGYTAGVGTREYIAVEGTEPSHEWAPYGRVGLRYSAGFRSLDLRPVMPATQGGLGIEGGYGHVLTFQGASAMGGDFYVSPSAFLRFGRLAMAVRVQWFEELAFIDEQKGELVDTLSTTYYGYELRYHFELNP
jgi:hypothetical protein